MKKTTVVHEYGGGVVIGFGGWLEEKYDASRVAIDGKEYRVKLVDMLNSIADMKSTIMLLDTTDEIQVGALVEFFERGDDGATAGVSRSGEAASRRTR